MSAIDELRGQVREPLIVTGDDPGYDEARAVHNGMFDKRPKVIVRGRAGRRCHRCRDFARESGLELSVRGRPHPGRASVPTTTAW